MNGNVKAWFVAGAVVAVMTCALWLSVEMANTQEANSRLRQTYIGHVTAIQSGESVTTIFLNSDAQVVKIYGSPVSLLVGQEYEIVLDGNGRLVNARIIGQ